MAERSVESWDYMVQDTEENARKVQEVCLREFPDVGFNIVIDPSSVQTEQPVANGNVLVKLKIPPEKFPRVMDLWAKNSTGRISDDYDDGEGI